MKTASLRSWARQIILVLCVFSLLGFATCALVFSQIPGRWTTSAIAALASSIGGVIGWAAICGRSSRPPWWRSAVAGALGGLILHPFWWLFAGLLKGDLLSLSELLLATTLSLLGAGYITLPAGLLAGLVCRALGRRQRNTRPLDTPRLNTRTQ